MSKFDLTGKRECDVCGAFGPNEDAALAARGLVQKPVTALSQAAIFGAPRLAAHASAHTGSSSSSAALKRYPTLRTVPISVSASLGAEDDGVGCDFGV